MTKLPSGNIGSTVDLGKAVRNKRKKDGLTQAEVAAICGLGNRFLVDLESGKPTVQLGKALEVLNSLGLEVQIVPRGWHGEVEK
jgi:HTH-type transcriptional regulator / antitoxin HipB